ncbi:MAG: DUF6602 domain-containing protein [Spirochaetota bacterium]|nr:DUF6602 domain-containing protein [Spirochaetota bacterium]
MFSDYFVKLEKNIIKKFKSETSKPARDDGKTAKGKSKKEEIPNNKELKDALIKIIPSHLKLDTLRLVDSSGYSPDGVDFIIYKEYFPDIKKMLGGKIPSELVYATIHISSNLNNKGLHKALNNVVQSRKVDRYIERETASPIIPAFIIAYNTTYSFPDLKEAIIDYYITRSISSDFETEIITILNKGIIIKNWREKRSYIALETGKDTLMWFFILMNEYLDVNKDESIDLRNYIKQSERYNEY